MWFFRRKKLRQMHQEKENEAEMIKAETKRRTDNATKPIKKLTKRFEQNGITLDIRRGMGNHHV